MSSDPLLPDLGNALVDPSLQLVTNKGHGSKERICRVCHCGEAEGEPLASPCLCVGSVEWIHYSCLNEWRLRSARLRDELRCELCCFNYIFEVRNASRLEALVDVFGRLLPFLTPLLMVGLLLVQVYSLTIAEFTLLGIFGAWAVVDLIFSCLRKVVGWEGLYVGVLGHYCRLAWCKIARNAEAVERGDEAAVLALERTEELQEEENLDGMSASTGRHVRCSRAGLEASMFAAILLFNILFCGLRNALGKDGLIRLGTFIAYFGGFYMALTLAMSLAFALIWPPIVTRHDASGLAVVRSLTPEEREAYARRPR